MSKVIDEIRTALALGETAFDRNDITHLLNEVSRLRGLGLACVAQVNGMPMNGYTKWHLQWFGKEDAMGGLCLTVDDQSVERPIPPGLSPDLRKELAHQLRAVATMIETGVV